MKYFCSVSFHLPLVTCELLLLVAMPALKFNISVDQYVAIAAYEVTNVGLLVNYSQPQCLTTAILKE